MACLDPDDEEYQRTKMIPKIYNNTFSSEKLIDMTEIGNWIPILVLQGLVDEVVWMAGHWCNQFDTGTYDLIVGRGTKSDSAGSGYCMKWGGDSGGSDRWGFRVATSSNDEDLYLDGNLAGIPHTVMTWDKVNGQLYSSNCLTIWQDIHFSNEE